MNFTFSRSPVETHSGQNIVGTEESIEMTPNLRKCSLENAMRYGGKIVRQILETAPITGAYENVYVETVVNYLLVGHIPTQPGWHIDETPSLVIGDPSQIANVDLSSQLSTPSLNEQLKQTNAGRQVLFHTMVLGNPCPTKFIDNMLTLDIQYPDNWGLLQEIHQRTRLCEGAETVTFPNGVWTTFDWWNIHTPTQATQSGWRLLFRIVENGDPPQLSDFLYPTHHVFVPSIQAL